MIYVGLGVVLFVFQKNYIYYPDDQDFESCVGFEDFEKRVENGTRFYYLPKSDKVLVYFHGNAGSACDRSFMQREFEGLGYGLIFVEYAGYSNDEKNPSKDLLLKDVQNVASFIEDEDYEDVVVIGTSLGSGLASYMTTIIDVDKLVLISSFDSTASVAASYYPVYPIKYLLRENYESSVWLKEFRGDVLIIHGEQDEMIDPKFSEKLFKDIHSKKVRRVLIPGKGHNDIFVGVEVFGKMGEFLLGTGIK
ncbi:alpha/beta hydrolase [Pseudomonadota bacterium]